MLSTVAGLHPKSCAIENFYRPTALMRLMVALRKTTLSAGLLVFKQQHARREAVDEILPADGAELALREEAGERDRAFHFRDHAGIVIGLCEEPGAAAIAAEEQCPLAAALPAIGAQEETQIFVRGHGIA